ncbi:MAG: TonB-dependent receptor plug domain-containing protein [Prevotellaceae bacterium]|jgi:TonB-dependent SusC/RagA subfamily outer membrane receptor|nr:TonB-dependent receptor plug domain-containing protein [Prevotellaceae bacterium]
MKKIFFLIPILLLLAANAFAQTQDKWDFFINKYPVEKIYLHSDRTFYQPGEQIRYKIYVTDASNNLKEALSEMATVELLNPRGGVDKSFSVYIKNGEGASSCYLPSDAPGGLYKLRAYTAWQRNFDEQDSYTKDIFVQKAQMPLLLMNLDFKRKAYSAGDEMQASLEVKTQQNEPLENYPLSYTVNIEGKTIQTTQARTDRNGKITLKAMLPTDIQSVDGTLNIMINYEGSTEAISRSIPLVLNKLNLQFFPEGGYLIDNVEGNLAFKATNEFGKPADVEGEIRTASGTLISRFRSEWMGLGSLRFTPQPGEQYHAVITSPQGITQQYMLPEAQATGYSMLASSPNKNTLRLTVHTPNTEPYFITVTAGETLITQDFTGSSELQQHSIDLSKLPAGVARVTLLNRSGTEQCERLVYAGERAPMHIKITADKKEYLPGEEATLNIETYDAENNPLPAKLSLSVIDDKIHAFADDRQDNILSWLLMSSELKGKVEDASYYFNPEKEKAMQSIDYVLLTHGWRRFTWKDINNPNIEIKSLPASVGYIGGTVSYKDDKGNKTGVEADVWLVSYGQEKTVSKLRTKPSGKFLFTDVDRSGRIQLIANAVHFQNKNIVIDTLSLDLRSLQKQSEEEKIARAHGRRTGIILEGEKVIETEKEIASQEEIGDLFAEKPSLEELVVTGYGETARRDLSSSIVTISADPLKATVSNAAEAMAGQMAGVQLTASESSPDANVQIRVRGGSSLTQSGGPLYIVDGMPVSDINDIPPSVISHIDVLKDASATAIYGARGANGVIVITTRDDDYRPSLPYYKNKGKNINYEPQYASILIPAVNAVSGLRESYNPRNYTKKAGETRRDFRRTLYWNPSITTDSAGKASIKLYNSDAVAAFRAIAEGIGGNKPGHGEGTFFTNLPFSITVKAPMYFCFGDTLQLPVILKNQTDKTLKGTLINDNYNYEKDWYWYRHHFNLLDTTMKEKELEIEPNSIISLYVPYVINNVSGYSPLNTFFKGRKAEDRVSRQIEVFPQGFPTRASFASADSTATYRFNINKPVNGSIQGRFVMNLSLLQQMLNGVEGLIRVPSGCFEQTTSKVFINAAAMSYLRQSGHSDLKTEKKLEDYIKTGYRKMISYEEPKGGFTWFGNGILNISLSAKCLMNLVEMKSFGIKGLDDDIITRTRQFILAHRDGKGNFIQEKDKYYYSVPNEVVGNAYTVYALSRAGISEIELEYKTAAAEALQSKDMYRLALMTNAAYNYKDYPTGDKLLNELNKVVEQYNYERVNNSNTMTYSWGNSYNAEVNSLHLSALLRAKQADRELIAKAFNELSKWRGYSGFGSTQATVLALNALTDYDKFYPVTIVDRNAQITLALNDTTIVRNVPDKGASLRIDSLQNYLREGENQVKISYSGLQNVNYGIDFGWTSLIPYSSPQCMVGLTTGIDSEHKKVGETARLTTVIENKTNSSLPMTIASIGIPAGAAPQHWQLKEIQEKAQADYVEIDKNFVVFYFVGMTPKEKRTINLDLRVETPGSFQAPASSAYLYYTDEHKVWNDGVKLKITP